MRLTIIGAGNMGGAIARALAGGTYFHTSDITCTARSLQTLERIEAEGFCADGRCGKRGSSVYGS